MLILLHQTPAYCRCDKDHLGGLAYEGCVALLPRSLKRCCFKRCFVWTDFFFWFL